MCPMNDFTQLNLVYTSMNQQSEILHSLIFSVGNQAEGFRAAASTQDISPTVIFVIAGSIIVNIVITAVMVFFCG